LLDAKQQFPGFGKSWIIGRLVMIVLAVTMLVFGAPFLFGGIFLIGYLTGSTFNAARTVLTAKKKWKLQEQLYDWAKIESLAKASQA
jgi:hypothetical protein